MVVTYFMIQRGTRTLAILTLPLHSIYTLFEISHRQKHTPVLFDGYDDPDIRNSVNSYAGTSILRQIFVGTPT